MVVLRVWEVVSPNVERGSVKRKKSTPTTGFEKNVAKLRGKERKLNARKPISPVKHSN